MEMLVIYDNTGRIFYLTSDIEYEPQGVPFLKVTEPEGKRLVSIDVSGETHTPVFEDLPVSDVRVLETQLKELTKQLLDTQEALAAIFESMGV